MSQQQQQPNMMQPNTMQQKPNPNMMQQPQQPQLPNQPFAAASTSPNSANQFVNYNSMPWMNGYNPSTATGTAPNAMSNAYNLNMPGSKVEFGKIPTDNGYYGGGFGILNKNGKGWTVPNQSQMKAKYPWAFQHGQAPNSILCRFNQSNNPNGSHCGGLIGI